MTDWSKKISSATIERRDYGMGVVIGYWSGIVTSGSVEEAAEKHGWPLVIEPFDKNRLFREITKLEAKIEEMQKALEWYADENNYEMVETRINEYSSETTSEAWTDSGERARQALRGVESQ